MLAFLVRWGCGFDRLSNQVGMFTVALRGKNFIRFGETVTDFLLDIGECIFGVCASGGHM